MANTTSFLNNLAAVPNNTYNYSNSSVFYSLVSPTFKNYYTQVIQICQQWLDGYVPNFHKADNGILSSRIAAKLCNSVANQIFGRGLVFVNGKNTTAEEREGIDFISHEWCDKVNFQNVVKQMIGYTYPLGTSLIKINKSDEELWCEALRADYFTFATDSFGKLIRVKCYIRLFQSTSEKDCNYCLVEERYFREEYEKFTQNINGVFKTFENKNKIIKVPVAVYKVYKINSTSNNNDLAANKGDSVPYKILPAEIKNVLKENYSAIILDKENVLPFKDYLGCELFKNEGGDITHPALPFGSPAIFNLVSSFMEYDLEISYSMRDLYNSKGIVGVPKSLSQSQISQISKPVENTGGHATRTSSSPFGQLNIPGFEFVSGLDPNTQKPIISQFEMRAQEHEMKQNAILKTIATSIGMSPRVIASYLVNGNEKTAEQTHSEDDTITNWTINHRKDYIIGLNKIIETVLSFHGINDNVEVKFASDGLMSAERQLEIISKKLELGLIDIDDAVRELNPDLDEVQLKEKIAKAQAKQNEIKQQQKNQFNDYFGGGSLDESGTQNQLDQF